MATEGPQKLARLGGPKLRPEPFPYRAMFGEDELAAVTEVFRRSRERELDFGFQGEAEEAYLRDFCALQRGGHADAVCSGSVAVYLALRSLELEAGSEVVLSPVTDPGCVSAVIEAGLVPVIADSTPSSWNTGVREVEAALSPRTRALVLTHCGGLPIEMDGLPELAQRHDLRLVEDCAQAHGAQWRGARVGTFGDVAAFSTMFSKAHATGGCGGIVYTRDEARYWKVRSFADRRKPFRDPDGDVRDPGSFEGPALNYNLDELSCAIGSATLARLEATIERRAAIVDRIREGLLHSKALRSASVDAHAHPSYFFHTVVVDPGRLSVSKVELAEAVAAEGIPVRADYPYVVSEWPWMQRHLARPLPTPNATRFRETTFNLLFNERFSDEDVDDVIAAMRKVDAAYAR